MRIFYKNGIHLQEGIKEVVLDPSRTTPGSVATHGHLDHLTKGALMTPETKDIMRVRRGWSDGIPLPYGKVGEVSGMKVVLKNAGHVLGSAMVRVGDVLYTGDMNPQGGPTCGKARPEDCEILITEATYGSPRFVFPKKETVIDDLLSWVEHELQFGPVAIGAYEFGKAQELIAIVNRIDVPVAVTERIAAISNVYLKHGHQLRYKRYYEMDQDERRSPHVYVVTRMELKKGGSQEIRQLRQAGGKCAYVSGWCATYNFTRAFGLDAQFPLSDHGDFDDLMHFVSECSPKLVYTCHGFSKELSKEIERRLGIESKPLN